MAAGALVMSLVASGCAAEPPRPEVKTSTSAPSTNGTGVAESPPTTVPSSLPSGDTGGTTITTLRATARPVATTVAVPPSTSSVPRVTAPPSVPEAGRPAGDIWHRLRLCESGGNYGANTGNGFYGAYQFSRKTWLSVGRTGMPHLASPAEQDAAARDLQARSGWGQWPSCARRLGLR